MSTYGCGPSLPARVLDMACGTGWSSIAMAQAYPHITVDGLDLDHDAISAARRSVEQAGVADRVRFSVTNAADLGGAGGYDLVTIFEAPHDMSQRGGGPPDPHRLLALLPTAPVRPTGVGPGLAKPSPATGLSEIRLLRRRCVRESCEVQPCLARKSARADPTNPLEKPPESQGTTPFGGQPPAATRSVCETRQRVGLRCNPDRRAEPSLETCPQYELRFVSFHG